ncbi:hypothetical protein NQ317_007471 [Molorchus minor]|uniref:Cathepsin L n=1 Tax=Molorchus minor TaxID=1323400 RepID=A0ABQ9K263_9CUCU|nr:hypothetical protein NQ317_007471 [Molorchus minor]
MKFLFVCASLILGSHAVSFFDLVQEEWAAFKLTHRKQYESETEERFRLKIYMENAHKIAKHNKLYAQGMVGYKLGINKYADMLHHEFVQTVNGFNKSKSLLRGQELEESVTFIPPANVKLPGEVDWRKEGLSLVSRIRDIVDHAGVSVLHGTKASITVKLKNSYLFSEQNLIDCSEKFGNNGCNGGLMDNAFAYIKKNGGIDTEASYPYKAEDEKCHYTPRSKGATDRGFVDIESGDENQLKSAVATVGPVSVAIDASHETFQLYSEGVYSEPECSSEQLDHGVLVVGYGTDENNQDYWIVKNSWGTSWGENGYIKMARNKNNMCGIATQASYPLV